METSLIIGYLLADNLHMIIAEYNYSPKWYVPYNPTYEFHDSIYYTLNYGLSLPLLMTVILFISSPMEINKIWLRFSMFLVSLRDFLGEVFETINLYIPNFGNYGYNTGTYIKIMYLIAALVITYKFKKTCMKLLKYLSSD